MEEGNGISSITRNRGEAAANGQFYGGVALVWRESSCSLRKLDYPNPDGFEVLIAGGKLHGHTRKLVVIACYLPPGYAKRRGEEALGFINGAVVHLKQKFTDPYIVLAGDFNQWDIEEALLDFPDLKAVSYTHLTLPTIYSV